MADTCYYAASGSCDLVGIMDRLWFRQIILFPDHPGSSPGNGSDDLDPDEGSRSESHPVITTCDELEEESDQSCLSIEESYKNEEEDKLRPTCRNSSGDDRARANSSSLSAEQDKGRRRRLRKWFSYSDPKSLRKLMSCRSFEDLEMEEVKGFMDLGFIFEKEHLNLRMMSVIPGLQRLGLAASDDTDNIDKGDEEGIAVMDGCKIRPYLSEAWLVRTPDSPLLKLPIPDTVHESADMRKHLKRWARAVASVIKLES